MQKAKIAAFAKRIQKRWQNDASLFYTNRQKGKESPSKMKKHISTITPSFVRMLNLSPMGIISSLLAVFIGNVLTGCSASAPAQEASRELIPKDLIAYFSDDILGSQEEMEGAMLSLASGQELDAEKIQELANRNPSIQERITDISSICSREGTWLEVDADNDGINDIFLCQYLDGSLHPVSYYLFQGTSDGNYILTDRQRSLMEEFGFIRWNGKNYLARITRNFEKKVTDGLALQYYENGRCSGGAWLSITAKEDRTSRSIQTSCLENEQYRDLAPSLETLAAEYQPGSRLPCGTAEKENDESDYNRSSDINNDGNVEQYDISLWQTTNYYTVDCLSFIPKNMNACMAISDIAQEDGGSGTSMNLWVDKTDYGNITYVLYEKDLYDFYICGYLISGTEYQKLIQTDCHVQTEVTVRKISPDDLP